MFGSLIGMGVLGLLAFIATIALCIFCYIKFMGKKGDRNSTLGRLLNFDKLYIDSIFRVLYLICVVSITVCAVVSPIAGLVGDGLEGLLSGFVGGILLFVGGQFFTRLLFEMSMAFIRLAVDTHEIRRMVAGGAPSQEGVSGPVGSVDPAESASSVDFGAAAASAASAAASAASKVSAFASKGAERVKAANAARAAESEARRLQAEQAAQVIQPVQVAPVAQPVQTAPVTQAAQVAPVAQAVQVAPVTQVAPAEQTAQVEQVAPAGSVVAPVVAFVPETTVLSATWNCTCGMMGNEGSFCGYCGSPRP